MLKREFLPGEEWIYYKIYCTHISVDEILLTFDDQIINNTYLNSVIDKWFFIRYNDPDYHLRLRIKLKEVDNLGALLLVLSRIFRTLFDKKKIISYSIDIYEREIEKYGATTITYFENISSLDSSFNINIIKACKSNMEERFLNAVLLTDSYLTLFGLTKMDKLRFCISRRDYFKEEFHSNSDTRRSLKVKYADLEIKISAYLLKPKVTSLLNFEKDLGEDIKNLTSKCDDDAILSMKFLTNLIHLHINRLFIRSQRKYEFVCFDVLSRYYATEIYKSRTK